MRETWYVLEDGRVVDPREVNPTAGGRLVHDSGVLVALRGPLPFTRNIDPDEERAPKTQRDMTPAPPPKPKRRRPYKTRAEPADGG